MALGARESRGPGGRCVDRPSLSLVRLVGSGSLRAALLPGSLARLLRRLARCLAFLSLSCVSPRCRSRDVRSSSLHYTTPSDVTRCGGSARASTSSLRQRASRPPLPLRRAAAEVRAPRDLSFAAPTPSARRAVGRLRWRPNGFASLRLCRCPARGARVSGGRGLRLRGSGFRGESWRSPSRSLARPSLQPATA